MQVELECFTAVCGHLPPREQPYPPNSPELRLTRFRKRWRITNGQYPNLWFCFWGRDESGGAGQGRAPNAPAGWDSMPARQYPLQRPPNVPTTAIYPFPGPNRQPPPAQPGTPQNARAPQNYATPQAPFTTTPASGLARQQQLAALQNQAALGLSSSNPTLEARQQQFQAQQQAMAAQQGRAGYTDPRLPPGYPAGLTPQQQLQAQQAFLLAQQQRQQQQPVAPSTTDRAQVQASRAAMTAQASAARAQRKAWGSEPSVAQPSSAVALNTHDDTAPPTDILDHLTPRKLAIHRYAHNHDILAPIFDPWPTSSILSGEPRRREVEEVLATTGISSRSGEPRLGAVPGLGRDGGLAMLATSAARISAFAALGKEPEKARLPLEERRNQLHKMLENIEGSIQRMEERHQEKVAQIKEGLKA